MAKFYYRLLQEFSMFRFTLSYENLVSQSKRKKKWQRKKKSFITLQEQFYVTSETRVDVWFKLLDKEFENLK